MNPNVLIGMVEELVMYRSDIQVVIGLEEPKDGPMFLSDRLLIPDASIPLKWVMENTHAVIHQGRDARLLAVILKQNKLSVAVPVTASEKRWANHLREMIPDMFSPPAALENVVGHPGMLAELAAKRKAAVEANVPSIWSHHVVLESNQVK
ncbi:hypothetical protein AC1031_003706 [Aphanomyces cochlioides]|nr:hypothetical protein AC1031_003706 [Aphanomyces cochlioides]